jgi:hypothetical protein
MMRPFLTLCLAQLILGAAAHAAGVDELASGDLVISELMNNPESVPYYRGQWIEIYNASGSEVDLENLVVTDGGSQTFTVSESVTVAAGDYAVLSVRSDPGENGGFTPDYAYDISSFSLSAGVDTIELSYSGTTFDSITYDNGVSFPDPFGSSMSIDPSALDATSNDTGSNWCEAENTFGDGDYGSPGVANDSCPVHISNLSDGDLLITEVMHDPSMVSYYKGEWFEVYNNSTTYVNLADLQIDDSGSDIFTVDEYTPLRPGEYAIFAVRDNDAVNGGIEGVDFRYIFGSEMGLTDNDDITLSYGVITFDSVAWDSSSFPSTSGVAMQLGTPSFDAATNDNGISWCDSSLTYGDGDYGTPGGTNGDCDADTDGDGFNEDVDCDDTNAAINPDAEELCDNVDNNCDGIIDNEPTDGTTYFADTDGDYYGDPNNTLDACSRPSDYRTNALDCNDADGTISPSATETCDGIDNNCSGDIDINAADATAYFPDSDSDGYGDVSAPMMSCSQPSGYLTDNSDCNDDDGAINPDAAESCDGTDNNCSGNENDAADGIIYYADLDKDFYGDPSNTFSACERPNGFRTNALDCDDQDVSINPSATETCDGIDDNCSGDEDDASDATAYYPDGDSDGYGDVSAPMMSCSQPSGFLTDGSDCNDADGAINPNAAETCDGTDNNCSGDENDAADGTIYYADLDSDFYGDPSNTFSACERPNGFRTNALDCDDSDVSINPSAAETCDGIDTNCSGDESDASDASTWYADTDEDGFGDVLVFANACTQPSGYLADSSDCDDGSAAVNPSESETCDGVDNNCSGDELDASDISTWYADSDADGFGDLQSSSDACFQPSGYIADSSDCDDGSAAVNPSESETCDGVDNNCSGDENDAADASTWYADSDADGFGDLDSTFAACTQPSGYLADSTDCDDDEGTTFPGADETCNDGVDSDCDNVDSTGTCDASLANADAIFNGESSGDLAGYHMTGGDINGDGFSDVIVGARLADGNGSDRGNTYVMFGPLTGEMSLGSADLALSGEADEDYSGGSVASGDFNNDGFDDLLIGALNEDAGGSNAGAAYVVFGPVSGDVDLGSADAKLTGTGAGDQAGKSIAAVGDVNNDGNDDLLIAGYKNDDVDTNAGSAYLFYGPATSGDLNNADVTLQGVSAQDMAGSWVTGAGDVDGDGYDDVLVGAYRANVEREGNNVSNVGITYLLQGPLSGTISLSAADASFIGENANDQSGAQLSKAGDVNNDGYDDFLIGAERADKNGTDDGAAYLLLGPVSGQVELSAADATFTGESDNDRAGRGVGAAGDLNNDGYDDLLFGAKENDNDGTGAGAAYVVLGPITGTLSLSAADAIYTGASAGDQAGMWVTNAGDVSGDGSPDMLVGGNSANSGSGATYLLLGDSWR